MRALSLPKTVVLIAIVFTNVLLSKAQQETDEAAVKRQEAAVAAAQANVEKFENQLTMADSLISTGNQMLAEAKSEIRAAENDLKNIDKEYLASRKTLEKKAGSKNKDEVAAAKADLKSLEIQYKQDTKNADLRFKQANKKWEDGLKNIEKGKKLKKSAGDGLKKSQVALEAAQKKLEMMKNPYQEKSTLKKKKK